MTTAASNAERWNYVGCAGGFMIMRDDEAYALVDVWPGRQGHQTARRKAKLLVGLLNTAEDRTCALVDRDLLRRAAEALGEVHGQMITAAFLMAAAEETPA